MNVISSSRTALAALGATSLALSLAACSPSSTDARDPEDTLNVAVSFYPIQYLTEAIGGEHVTVTSVTPANAEPHDFELSPKDVSDLSSVDVVAYVSGFQPSLDDALTQVEGPTVLDLSTTVDLVHHDGVGHDHGAEEHSDDAAGHEHSHEHEHSHGADEGEDATASTGTEASEDSSDDAVLDPHFWLDPERMTLAAGSIATALSEADPDNAADYEANLATLTTTLTDLDTSYTEGLAQCERTTFVTTHAAFGYLADRYGLTQASISGIDPEHEPSPAELAAVKKVVESTGTTVIFTEELVSPETAQAVAAETGATTAVLSPIESAPAAGSYDEAMTANLAELRTALACQ